MAYGISLQKKTKHSSPSADIIDLSYIFLSLFIKAADFPKAPQWSAMSIFIAGYVFFSASRQGTQSCHKRIQLQVAPTRAI
jgi:hypothetical protein